MNNTRVYIFVLAYDGIFAFLTNFHDENAMMYSETLQVIVPSSREVFSEVSSKPDHDVDASFIVISSKLGHLSLWTVYYK
jgi:hypothetical protein